MGFKEWDHLTMRSRSTTTELAKRVLNYYRISKCICHWGTVAPIPPDFILLGFAQQSHLFCSGTSPGCLVHCITAGLALMEVAVRLDKSRGLALLLGLTFSSARPRIPMLYIVRTLLVHCITAGLALMEVPVRLDKSRGLALLLGLTFSSARPRIPMLHIIRTLQVMLPSHRFQGLIGPII